MPLPADPTPADLDRFEAELRRRWIAGLSPAQLAEAERSAVASGRRSAASATLAPAPAPRLSPLETGRSKHRSEMNEAERSAFLHAHHVYL